MWQRGNLARRFAVFFRMRTCSTHPTKRAVAGDKCSACYAKERRLDPVAKAIEANAVHKYRFCLTLEERQTIELFVERRCEICGREKPLQLDHDHETGDLRGMLCASCNTMIGKASDSPERLRRAAAYLEAAKAGTSSIARAGFGDRRARVRENDKRVRAPGWRRFRKGDVAA
jgi:hypothetical protein